MGNDANITLRIDSDAGQGVQGLLSMEQAERKLEVAVKAGNSTLKLRANTEAEIAKILPAIAAAEGRVVTATQRRAAASLAAQKSAALLKQMTDAERAAEAKMNEQTRASISLQRQRSAALLKQMTDAERAAEAKMNEQTRASISLQRQRSAALEARLVSEQKLATLQKSMGAGFAAAAARALNDAEEANYQRTQRRMADMAQGQKGATLTTAALAKSLGILGAATAAVGIAFDEVSAAQERAMSKALRSDALASGMKDLVMALPEGPEGDAALRKILKTGAENGMAPDAAASLAAPIYATADKNSDNKLDAKEQEAFDKNLGAGAALASTGVAGSDATNIILAGDNKGVAGEDTAAKLLAAATISKRGPAEFSKSASPISQFDDLNTGLAVTTALSAGELNPERLSDRTKDVQLSLSSAADQSNFSKKYGLAGLSQGEKIAKLRSDAVASGDVKKFTDQFQNVEGLDEGKASSLAMLVQQGELFNSAEKTIRATGAKDLAPAIQKLKDNPLTGSQMKSAEAAAASANADLFGTGADAAREERAAALARGAELRRYGGDRAVNEDGTEKTFSYNPLNILGAQNRDVIGGRLDAMWNGMPGTGLNKGGINQDTKMTGFEKLEKQLELLNSTLEKNTAATVANSGAAAGGGAAPKATGGAVSNAEEKY